MSKYTFIQDCWIGQFYYQAGTSATTADVGGTLPTGWVPNAAVDPLDTAAVTAFYNAGVQQPEPAKQQFSNQNVAAPATYWKPTIVAGSQAPKYSLTGLGVSKTPIFT